MVHPLRQVCIEAARRSHMFKKSEEQEWTRFRGALSKDRDETGAAPPPTEASADQSVAAPATPSTSTQPAAVGPSFRSTAVDVNVGLPTTRMSRNSSLDGTDVKSLIGEH